ncbi:Ger(x)C family spore germination protein [Bacillus cereus]|uniref:Spore gernimation protein n=1 Tax=Bacillus cereus TaxID=1396 RepID=A0A2A9A145_BACCE|nr:Ger(x)C family spore germination C-terminal domain-containing protein [Bacillus cereus]PFE15273.1 spore gernimation protein [Bacillus cereus]
MKRLVYIGLFLFLLIVLSSSIGKLNMEDATFTLTYGIDVNQNNELEFYATSPVFGREIEVKKQILGVKSSTIRQSRKGFDQRSPGLSLGSKIQIILIGNKLLKDPNWFSLLDVFYRDFKGTVSPIVVVVDGPVSEIIYYTPKNQPRTTIFLKKLITTAKLRGETVNTNLQELHRQMYEKGATPYLSNIKKNQKIILNGSTLLTERGNYSTGLTVQETALLQILQGQKANYSLTLPIFTKEHNDSIVKNRISFTAQDIQTKIKTKYINGKFQFDIQVAMKMIVTEKLFPYDMRKNNKKLEDMVEQQLKIKFQNVIKKIQKDELDPIGLGLYARAHQYKEFTCIQDTWGETLSKANINITIKLKTNSMGAIK